MKTQKLIDAFKAFETKDLKTIIGGTAVWKVTGWWSPSAGVTYQDWASSTGTMVCDYPDGSYPF
jgi:hypothetical protein